MQTDMFPILSNPSVYMFIQKITGAKRARLEYIKQYISPVPEQRILDIGCGTGYVIEYFPGSGYVGIDIDQACINYAKRKYGCYGEFLCQELDDATVEKFQPFNFIIMNGLLHHLNDQQVTALFHRVKRLLKTEGQLVTLDGCYVKGQPFIAKKLLDFDQGKHIRDEKGYRALASGVFSSVVSYIRNDLTIIPYTLIIMQIK